MPNAAPPEISGDVSLSRPDSLRYLLYGLRQIVQAFSERRKATPYRLSSSSGSVEAEYEAGASPIRTYTAAFIQEMAAKRCAQQIVCDIGCGAGGQARFFETAGASLYFGIDPLARDSWLLARQRMQPPRRFGRMVVEQLALREHSIGVTYSSSSLEHIPGIHAAIQEIGRVTAPGGYGIHIVPSVWALFLYPFHGFRRFSSAGLARLFESAGLEVIELWGLGGLPSFLLHTVVITWLETGSMYLWLTVPLVPRVLRRLFRMPHIRTRGSKATRLYSALLRAAVKADCRVSWPPSAYAIVVSKPQLDGAVSAG